MIDKEQLNNNLQKVYEYHYSHKPINGFYQVIGEIYVDMYPDVDGAEKRINEFVQKELEKINEGN